MKKINQCYNLKISKSPPSDFGCQYSTKGKREYMEDDTCYTECMFVIPNKRIKFVQIFGLFDGHGGDQLSNFLSENLSYVILDNMEKVDISTKPQREKNIPLVLSKSFTNVQRYIHKHFLEKFRFQGSTALIVLKIDKELYTANVGDSRAIFFGTQSGLYQLSEDHKPNLPREKSRIEKMGGYISGAISRVWKNEKREGIGLSTSRSLGDLHSYLPHKRDYLISPIPDVTKLNIKSDESYFIVLGSDGVWDVLKNIQVVNIVINMLRGSKKMNPILISDACKKIVQEALKKGSMDNITSLFFIIDNFYSK